MWSEEAVEGTEAGEGSEVCVVCVATLPQRDCRQLEVMGHWIRLLGWVADSGQMRSRRETADHGYIQQASPEVLYGTRLYDRRPWYEISWTRRASHLGTIVRIICEN